jgi:hypothetical protein
MHVAVDGAARLRHTAYRGAACIPEMRPEIGSDSVGQHAEWEMDEEGNKTSNKWKWANGGTPIEVDDTARMTGSLVPCDATSEPIPRILLLGVG